MNRFLIILFTFSLCFISCDEGFLSRNAKDPVIARVGEKKLFRSKLEGLVHDGISITDSVAIIDGFIQNWIRESLMIEEAEKNVAADINLTKLVEDYRSSLLVYNYEKKLIDDRLDTLISNFDKQKYYNENKGQYILSHPILKCLVAKIPSKVSGSSVLVTALKKSDLTEAMFLIKEKASFHHLDTAKWMRIQDLNAFLPWGILNVDDIKSKAVFHEKQGDSEYFVKIIKFFDEKEIPPFDYIQHKISKVILGERKIQLLKKFRQDLYEKGISDNKFEIYKNK